MNLLLLLLILLPVVGCTPNIVDRDFEAEESAYIKEHGVAAKDPLYAPATPDTVFAGKENNVFVSMYKDKPEDYKGMKLQIWQATIVNHSDHPICALVHWKLMDFEMFSDYPDFTYLVSQQQILHFAEMRQQIWNIDGTEFALPPSGYIDQLIVKEPIKDAKKGTECSFEDNNIEEI